MLLSRIRTVVSLLFDLVAAAYFVGFETDLFVVLGLFCLGDILAYFFVDLWLFGCALR